MGKEKRKRVKSREARDTLTKQILVSNRVKPLKESTVQFDKGADNNNNLIEPNLSGKILKLAKDQQKELLNEFSEATPPSKTPLKFSLKKSKLTSESDNSSDSESDVNEEFPREQDLTGVGILETELKSEDILSLDTFMPGEHFERTKISDLIEQALKAKRTELSEVKSQMSGAQGNLSLDPGAISVFKKVGIILSKYRSGKVPKPFKVLPRLQRWEELLLLTSPDNWTAASVYQATRFFSSNGTPTRVERFYRLVLLPRVRDDIAEFGKLNYHLYASLKKALFKPAAFFKAIIIPLATTENCTLREACIIGSLLAKTSIPLLHSAACLMKLAEMKTYEAPRTLIIRILINKKYCLPYRVLDELVNYFLSFEIDTSQELPVLWHQCLLILIQIYKQDMSHDQKQALISLINTHKHASITQLIKFELKSSLVANRVDAKLKTNISDKLIPMAT